MKTPVALAILVWLSGAASLPAIVMMDWVTVGDPGNLNNPADGNEAKPGIQNFGAVAYEYQISKYETTNAQYAEFLNAADPNGSNPNNIYNSNMGSEALGGIAFDSGAAAGSKYSVKTNMGDKPVNWVSILDAQRFANWMYNGQGSGSTETGVYAVGNLAVHASSASVWIPTENEWYKAAYYDPTLNSGAGGYWLYATKSNTAPTVAAATAIGIISNPGANVANYFLGADWNGQDGNVTTVGSAGLLSASYYGTFDQGGNVWEWNESIDGVNRGLLGGGYEDGGLNLRSTFSGSNDPLGEGANKGFRLASAIADGGSTFAMLGLALAGIAGLSRKFSV